MSLREEVHTFGLASERILSPVISNQQPLTKEEAALIDYYCKELQTKIAPILGKPD